MVELPRPIQDPESPFWQLLADAEEIQIREFDATVPASLPDDLAATHVEGRHRAFVVRVKSRPPVGHPPVPPPEPSDLKPIPPEDALPAAEREHLLASASLLVDNGDHILARHVYSYLLKLDDRDPAALKGLGVCLFRVGDLISAKKLLQAWFDQEPCDEGRYWLGQLSLACGDIPRALAHFAAVTDPGRLTPTDRFQLYREWGNALARTERWSDARDAYTKALAVEPDSDSVLGSLGTIELECGSPERAMAHFRRALEANPRNQRARCGAGMIAMSQGDFETAKRELEIAAENDPKQPDLFYALAIVDLERGDWEGCRSRLQLLIEKHPGFEKARRLLDEINRCGGQA